MCRVLCRCTFSTHLGKYQEVGLLDPKGRSAPRDLYVTRRHGCHCVAIAHSFSGVGVAENLLLKKFSPLGFCDMFPWFSISLACLSPLPFLVHPLPEH